jgi:hypothetical protein
VIRGSIIYAERLAHPRRGWKPEFKEGRYPPLDGASCSPSYCPSSIHSIIDCLTSSKGRSWTSCSKLRHNTSSVTSFRGNTWCRHLQSPSVESGNRTAFTFLISSIQGEPSTSAMSNWSRPWLYSGCPGSASSFGCPCFICKIDLLRNTAHPQSCHNPSERCSVARKAKHPVSPQSMTNASDTDSCLNGKPASLMCIISWRTVHFAQFHIALPSRKSLLWAPSRKPVSPHRVKGSGGFRDPFSG